MAVDRHEVDKAIVTKFTATAAITNLIGNPPRIYARPRRDLIFPWVRLDGIAISPWLRTMASKPPTVHRILYQFTAFAKENTLDTVANIHVQCDSVLTQRDQFTISGATLVGTEPGVAFQDIDEHGTAFALWEYTFIVQ